MLVSFKGIRPEEAEGICLLKQTQLSYVMQRWEGGIRKQEFYAPSEKKIS